MVAAGQPNPQSVLLARSLSTSRMAPFLLATEGNVRDALRLYRWNIELSGATYQALHLFEVVLRNAIDEQLRAWNQTQHDSSGRPYAADWVFDAAPLLLRLVQNDELKKATRRARQALRHSRQTRALTHGDVIAQLSLGTWRFLLPDADPGRQYLWTHAVQHAFPHLTRTPQQLLNDVDGIHRLRNRVAHLEPLLLHGVVEARLRSMRRVLREIEPATEQWLTTQQQISTVITRRP